MDRFEKVIHLKISGRVQGVGFRHFTRKNAGELGLSGWVKNMADGSVEAVLAGEKQSLKQMVERLKSGPVTASVSDIEISEAAEEPSGGPFRVVR
ncbi:MAG: acylphosphatase [Balneolaceae bacterium]|nr:acylphosphatase [Balneolaceae bacterium]